MIVDNAWDVIVLGSGVAGLAAGLAASMTFSYLAVRHMIDRG